MAVVEDGCGVGVEGVMALVAVVCVGVREGGREGGRERGRADGDGFGGGGDVMPAHAPCMRTMRTHAYNDLHPRNAVNSQIAHDYTRQRDPLAPRLD